MADLGESSKSRVVFVKTSIDTRLGLLLDSDDSVSAFKDKICKEHEQCFPSVGKITISSALKVNLGGNDYHLPDSMILKKALQGISNNNWFLSVDVMHVEEKGELQIGEVALANHDLHVTKNNDPSEVVEKKTRKRKPKSSGKSSKKPSVETPTEAKDVESGEGNVTIMGENQHAYQEELVDGHANDVEANLDLMGTMEQDLQKDVANADLVMIDEDKDLEKDNLLTELYQTSDDAENEGLIDPVNATCQAIENYETGMGTKEEDGDEEAKSEKPKKKKRARKDKNLAKEDGLVASSSRNAEEDVEKAARKSKKKSKKQESSNVVEEDA
ncbi:unnamed protein product [Arabidopsis lyrata]|uniref:Uncharacterized protein n=1 Tax=Arabidopsis lyrata subsp. lyrata TaxID=81972 RepID=D7KNV6_ARALL|nr:hypothetical protein ARALYDRAFT_337696 [Arabidopsis lyrata subsp. lyrata]CAH8255753.1 unnamed protein product [Arabidopsis lyrata]